MLLEKQILNSPDSALAPRPAKRARGVSDPLPEGTVAWVEMARCRTLTNDSVAIEIEYTNPFLYDCVDYTSLSVTSIP